MNETFSFSRFGRYFLFDLKQTWRRHSRAAIVIGCAGLFFYVIWALFSLVFNQTWSSPVLGARMFVFLLAFGILEFYFAYLYGFVTDKKKGSAYLMIPASTTEKFVSLLLMSLFVVPILFVVVYLGIDGILSLADPTYGASLVGSISGGYQEMIDMLVSFKGEGFPFSLSQMVYPILIGFIFNILYYVLCGLCFKKYKIIGALAISFLFSIIITMIAGIAARPIADFVSGLDLENIGSEQLASFYHTFLAWTNVITTILTVGLGAGIYYRLKTIKH